MGSPLIPAKSFRSFADLAAAYKEGVDFRITRVPRPGSAVGIVAPHGGSIEAHTSSIATAIAGADHSLYLLEGIRRADNYAALHLTSHHFDEPSCLELLASCDDVVSIHGCSIPGEVVLVGGLDKDLATDVGAAIAAVGLECRLDGHEFPATDPDNICNRGRRAVGVQLELSLALRMSPRSRQLVAAVREVLQHRETQRQQTAAGPSNETPSGLAAPPMKTKTP